MALAIFSFIAAAMMSMALGGFQALERGGEQTEAEALAQEGLEAVKAIQERAWNEMEYGVSAVSNVSSQWEFVGEGTTENIGQFTRTITIADVCRDASDNIDTCPSNYTDEHTKRVIVEVTWDTLQGNINTVRQEGYLTNWDSTDWTQTDWVGGDGQSIWSDTTQYDTGSNVDDTIAGQISLAAILGDGCGLKVWPFTTAGNYTYDSQDIEVTGGNAQLVGTVVSGSIQDSGFNNTSDTDYNWPFTTAGNYTYDSNKITVTGGAAQLYEISEVCQGTPDPCAGIGVQGTCTSQGGCSWDPADCSGSPTACGSLPEGDCSACGCSLVPGNCSNNGACGDNGAEGACTNCSCATCSWDATSCPYVEAWDGQKWVKEHEAFPYAVFKSVVNTTYDSLPSLACIDGHARVRIYESLPEITYLQYFQVFAAKQTGGYIKPDVEGRPRVMNNWNSPDFCITSLGQSGQDCLNIIKDHDEEFFEPEIDKSKIDEWIEMEFRDVKNDEAKLYLVARNQQLIAIYYQYIAHILGRKQADLFSEVSAWPGFYQLTNNWWTNSLKVQVEVWDGSNWQRQGVISAGFHMPGSGADDFLVSLKKLDDSNNLKVRIRFMSGAYGIDYIALDDSLDQELDIKAVNPKEIYVNGKLSDDYLVSIGYNEYVELVYDCNLDEDYYFGIGGYYNIDFYDSSRQKDPISAWSELMDLFTGGKKYLIRTAVDKGLYKKDNCNQNYTTAELAAQAQLSPIAYVIYFEILLILVSGILFIVGYDRRRLVIGFTIGTTITIVLLYGFTVVIAGGTCGGTLNCSGCNETACNLCATCTWNAGSCSGTPSVCTTHSTEDQCSDCGCSWDEANCFGTSSVCSTYATEGNCNGQQGCIWSGEYATTSPSIYPTSSYSAPGVFSWDSFSATTTVSGSPFVDDESSEFNGAKSNTQYDSANYWLELTSAGQTAGSGTYTSPIRNVGANASWDSIAWIPTMPFGKELPNGGSAETAYLMGNVDMSDNVLLLHLSATSTSIIDWSGNGYNGTYNGALTGQTGKLNGALGFDGTDDIVTFTYNLNSTLGGTASLAFWINTTDTGNNNVADAPAVTGVEESGGDDDVFWGSLNASGKFVIQAGNTAGAVSSTTINDGSWHHVVMTRNSTTGEVKIYVDGVLEDTAISDLGVKGNAFYTIGRLTDTGFPANHYYLQGTLDELAIFDTVIDEDMVMELYKRGALRIKYQVKSCNDSGCVGESFIGPDGTTGDYYDETDNTTNGLPSLTLTNVSDNPYFQYRATLETDDTALTPELRSFTTNYTGGGLANVTYQLSDDDGTTWYYWGGSSWDVAGASNSSTEATVDANISDFSTSTEQIKFKAFLNSEGTQNVELDNVFLGFTPGGSPWTYSDWDAGGGEVNPDGTIDASGGNPGSFAKITVPNGQNDELGGYFEQAFTTTVDNPSGTVDFDYKMIAFNATANVSQIRIFVDTSSGAPTNQVGSSIDVTSAGNWTSASQIDISSDLGTAGTYYLKVAYWVETPGGGGGGPFVVGFDNVDLNWTLTTYPDDEPTIQPTESYEGPGVNFWSSFSETATKGTGEIYYQLSDDDGSNWYYWGGSSWVSAGASNYNTASVINSNIGTFSTSTETILFKAFLDSDGTQQVQLDQVAIYCSKLYDWPFSTPGDYTYDDQKIEVTGGQAQLVESGGYVIRSTEYAITDYTGVTGEITLTNDLSSNYFVMVKGSDGDGTDTGNRGPDENYFALTSDPFGTGDLAVTGENNTLGFTRGGNVDGWTGVITVVECLNNCSSDGFELLDVARVTHSGTTLTGTDTFTSGWGSDIDQVMLFGGYDGAGCNTADTDNSDHKVCHARIWPSGTNTINWQRNDTDVSSMTTAYSTVMALKWGSNWTVQRVTVSGSAGGAGANATGEYNTATINSVARDNTWVWGTGWTNDQGIGDASEGTLITLGDGVNQNTNETSVAVGQEYSDTREFEVYALTHDDISVDYRFKADGNGADLTYDQTVDTAASSTARMALGYNTCNGTGDAYPRPIFSARYTSNTNIQLLRNRWNQAFVAWTQSIDFSGINKPITYPSDDPTIQPSAFYNLGGVSELTAFEETANKDGGEIYYQLSNNNGATWLYWGGSNWTTAGASDYNTASVVNTNIGSFPTSTTQFLFKAFLSGNGSQQVALDNVRIFWGEDAGGGGSVGYETSGFLVSSALDMGDASPVQVIEWSEDRPADTEIKLQVRTAPDSGGSPGTWTDWFGETGSGTFFTTTSPTLIPTTINANQWLQYRAELSGDGTVTPVLYDINLNYK